MKKDVMARQRAIVANVGLTAQPTFPITLQANESKNTGRRPQVWESGLHTKGPAPKIAINRDRR